MVEVVVEVLLSIQAKKDLIIHHTINSKYIFILCCIICESILIEQLTILLSKLVIIFFTNNLKFRLVAATIVNNTSKYTPNGHWVICFRGKRAIDPSIKLLSKCKRDGDQLVCEHI